MLRQDTSLRVCLFLGQMYVPSMRLPDARVFGMRGQCRQRDDCGSGGSWGEAGGTMAPGALFYWVQRTAVRSLAWVGAFSHKPSILAFATPVLAS